MAKRVRIEAVRMHQLSRIALSRPRRCYRGVGRRFVSEKILRPLCLDPMKTFARGWIPSSAECFSYLREVPSDHFGYALSRFPLFAGKLIRFVAGAQ
jgi:hypothetical protein